MAQFIGARTVNERRRRRLALEAAHAEPAATAFAAKPTTLTTDDGSIPAVERTRIVSRINSLIRPEPWKTWTVIALAALLQQFMVWGGAVIDRSYPAVSEIFGLAAGHGTRYFTVLMLLCVTQLSFIILWYRTHSRKDFHGRYRVWIWSSGVWPLFLIASIRDAHLTLSQRIGTAIPSLGAAFGERLWVVPAVILFWSTVRVISRDMCRCRGSRWLVRISAVLAAASLVVDQVSHPVIDRIGLAGTSLLQTSWPMFLAAALLHHARFVIHVTNEVSTVKRRPSRLVTFMRAGWDEMWEILPSQGRLAQHVQPRRILIAAAWLLRSLFVLTQNFMKSIRTFAASLKSRIAAVRVGSCEGGRVRKPRRDSTAIKASNREPPASRPVATRREDEAQPLQPPHSLAPNVRPNEPAQSPGRSHRDRPKGRKLQGAAR